jgi:ketose-bisphosphate aldolase
MAIVSMGRILRCAEENRFAVGYFESFNMESTQAVIDAAETLESPVIIGYSGVFMNSPRRELEENVYDYGAMAVSMARHARIPVAIILNEADDLAMLVKSLGAGFNTVMYQKAGESFEDTVEITRYLVRTAHFLGAEVESEVGELPEADVSTGTVSTGVITDPDTARYFVETTGVDALAVAVGNVHLLEGRKSMLDLELLKTLRREIKVPLVLHGGTGMAEDEVREAIALGISKINIGTMLKRVYLRVLSQFCCGKDIDRINPHELVGLGGPADLVCSARKAIAEAVAGYMEVFGSSKRAALI